MNTKVIVIIAIVIAVILFGGLGTYAAYDGSRFQYYRDMEEECYFCLSDVNDDHVDELLFACQPEKYELSTYVIFTYYNDQVKYLGSIYGDYPVYTSEYTGYLPDSEYEQSFPKPKDGTSLVFVNPKKKELYFGNYSNGMIEGGEFQNYMVTENSLEEKAYCSKNIMGDSKEYVAGLNQEKVSMKEYSSYLTKHFEDKGSNLKFYAYKEFLGKCES
ncbi:MAG: hypothetical protein Q4F05_03705 [bacterium]|nr:hypothetical protein [bacterium]